MHGKNARTEQSWCTIDKYICIHWAQWHTYQIHAMRRKGRGERHDAGCSPNSIIYNTEIVVQKNQFIRSLCYTLVGLSVIARELQIFARCTRRSASQTRKRESYEYALVCLVRRQRYGRCCASFIVFPSFRSAVRAVAARAYQIWLQMRREKKGALRESLILPCAWQIHGNAFLQTVSHIKMQ
jgi:hypothetical protein